MDDTGTPPKRRRSSQPPGEAAAPPRKRSPARAATTDEVAKPVRAPRKRASPAGGDDTQAKPAAPRRPASRGKAAPRPVGDTDSATITTPSSTPSAAPPPVPASAPRAPAPRRAAPDETPPAAAAPRVPSAVPATAPAPSVAPVAESSGELPDFVPSFARAPAPPPRAAAQARPADASPRSTRFIEWLCQRLPPAHRDRVRNYLVLMRLDRPVGALLLLWPTWWALWFAARDFPPPGALLIFTLGVFVMRSAGCVINDYADHGWLDAHVERTRGRPMAAGRVSKQEALRLFAGLLGLAFVLVLFTNALTIRLAFVGAALAAIYPYTKRVTHLAQVVLGAAFGWSIPMAFAAVSNSLPPLCWLLFLANVLFSTIYDTQYAMVDREDDLRVGARSTAILFGDADRAIIAVLMATFVLAMGLAGTRAALHWPYFLGLAAAAGLFVWQQWLMRDRAREHCFAAFRNNNWVGLVLWLGLLFALALR